MTELLLAEVTRHSIQNLVTSPSHAVLITGPTGIGKFSVAGQLAAALLQARDYDAANNAKTLLITPDKNTIGIDEIRRLQHFLSLKSTETSVEAHIVRIVLIDQADLMSLAAQNALLKSLEEAPLDSCIILTANSFQSLLPTIVSRTQRVEVYKPDTTELQKVLLAQGYAETAVTKVLALSDGLPGAATALLAGGSDHPMLAAADLARRLLGATAFERLAMVDELAKQKELLIDTCTVLARMASLTLRRLNLPAAQQKRWQSIMKRSLTANDDLQHYVQPKLVLSRLFLSL